MQGVKSGTIAPFTAPGARPMFFNDEADSAIKVLGSSVHIAGIDLEGAGTGSSNFSNAGITDDCSCTPVLNTFIENVNIDEFSYAGISFGDGAQVTIRNTSVSKIGGVGIAFYSDSAVTIANTTVTNVGEVGITFGLDNRVTLSGVTVSGVLDGDGMSSFDGNTVTITNTVVNLVIARLRLANVPLHQRHLPLLRWNPRNDGEREPVSIRPIIVRRNRVWATALTRFHITGVTSRSIAKHLLRQPHSFRSQRPDLDSPHRISFGYRTTALPSRLRVDNNGIVFGSRNTVVRPRHINDVCCARHPLDCREYGIDRRYHDYLDSHNFGINSSSRQHGDDIQRQHQQRRGQTASSLR